MDDDKTMSSDSTGKRKTHVSIFPQAMKDCFNKVQSKPPRCPDFMLKEHLDYKKQIGTNEIWDDYLWFIKECGVSLTIKQHTLRLHYQSLVGMDIWEDYYTFMMNQGFYDYIDYDYKQMYKKTPVVKTNIKSTSSTYIRFFHKKNDKLLYNLNIEYDCIIKYEYGIWYLHIPYVRQPRKEPKSQTAESQQLKETNESTTYIDALFQSIVGLDPGFKTFLAFYSQMIHGKIQQNNIFKKICSKLDYYNKLYYGKKIGNVWINQPKQISYTKYIYITNLLYRKQSHLAMQMHYNTITFLTGNFNWILLPSFESQEIVKGKKLSKETKREASQLQHYKFKQRLQSACSSMKNCKVLIVSEAWTSKTCGRCGSIKTNLTLKDRIYSCNKCGLSIDRDVNGSRNILLRNIQG
jgi:transposase